MKRLALPLAHAAAAIVIGMLAACGTWPGHQPAPGANAESSSAQVSGTEYDTGRRIGSGTGRLAVGEMMGDRQAMCELHRRMMAADTPEARQAAIDKYLGTMTPETRHHLLQMMREQCR